MTIDHNDRFVDDEAFARALQAQYDQDFERRSRRPDRSGAPEQPPTPTAPVETPPFSQSLEVTPTSSNHGTGEEDVDAMYARRVEREIREQEMRMEELRRLSQLQQPKPGTPLTSRSNSYASSLTPAVTDEDYARRVEQELRDEELARHLSSVEQQRASVNRAQIIAASQPAPPSRRCTARRICAQFIPLAIITAAVVGIVYYFVRPEGLPFGIPNPQVFGGTDPFSNITAADASRWRTNGKGLTLTVVNSLDSLWYPYFYKAVTEWDNGAPDALTLSTEVQSVDSSCSIEDGVLRVCNGNYGATNWRGINKVMLNFGYIYASAARMNDYYFSGKDADQRQYTMCHEIGHGFGLPHTDENFYNRDLGNCMDYTVHPELNKQPTEMNYDFLAQLYGSVDGNLTALPYKKSASGQGRRDLDTYDDGDDDVRVPSTPNTIRALLDELDSEIDLAGFQPHRGWRALHISEFGESHRMDLGEGYTLIVHMMW